MNRIYGLWSWVASSVMTATLDLLIYYSFKCGGMSYNGFIESVIGTTVVYLFLTIFMSLFLVVSESGISIYRPFNPFKKKQYFSFEQLQNFTIAKGTKVASTVSLNYIEENRRVYTEVWTTFLLDFEAFRFEKAVNGKVHLILFNF